MFLHNLILHISDFLSKYIFQAYYLYSIQKLTKGCVMLKTNVSVHMILHVHQRQKHRIFLFRFIMSAPVLEGGPTVPRP